MENQKEPIVGRFIIEILGAPKEYIEKALKEHIEKIKNDGVDVRAETFEEPVQKDELWTQFVELEAAFPNATELLNFCFDSMPSSVELLSPEKMSLETKDFEGFLNDFQAKLHHVDMMIKNLQAQKNVLDRNTINILHNFMLYACETKPYKLEELSKLLGLGEKELKPFVEQLVEKGALKKREDETYARD